jgi:ribonuclease HII
MKSTVKKGIHYIIGIDEVGRGPIAGPVTVGAFIVPVKNYSKFLQLVNQLGITDSKKLTAKKREHISRVLCDGTAKRLWYFHIAMSSVTVIDKQGIVAGITKAIKKSIDQVVDYYTISPTEVSVFLDGGLKAPIEYLHQETVIKGDAKIPVISAASILAKVHRDRYMEILDKKYGSKYDWSQNKGYGTKKHYATLKKYGISDMHRKSFLRGE